MLWRSIVSRVQSYGTLNNHSDLTNNNVLHLESGDTINLENSKSCNIYQTLLNVNYEKPICVEKYNSSFPELSENEVGKMFILARLLCRDIEIQSMQYKILHRYIPTNDLLFKMKKVVSNRCTFCDLYPENILHLFFECMEVKTLLNNLNAKLNNFLNCNIRVNCKDVILGYRLTQLNTPNVKLINRVVLHAKLFYMASTV